MTVTAKFLVKGVKFERYWAGNDQPPTLARRIDMEGVWAGNNPDAGEDYLFGKATPQATLTMLVVNKEAADQFELNGEYYVTFEKAKDGLAIVVQE